MRHLLPLLALAVGAASGTSCRAPIEAPPGTLVVVKELQASWIRNFNPFAPTGASRWPTVAGVYEPMGIFNSMRGELVPWLATRWEWEDDNRTLVCTLREDVRWSDGQPFSADDVVFTFSLLKDNPAFDLNSLASRLSSVTAEGRHQVRFTLTEPHVPALLFILQQALVPKHVWQDIEDPVTFANPSPVGTGPFTEVRRFDTQVYELGRNPHYWQADAAPGVEALRLPALPSNEQANLALIHGEVDWTGTFIPAVDRVYVERDPDHHQYWFPLVGAMVFLYANTTQPPLDDVRVRKALSRAIDRDLLVRIAMHDTTRPADVTALTDRYAAWRDNTLVATADPWTAHAPAQAGAELDALGFARGPDGLRRDAAGQPLALELQVVSGWSDWVRAAQIISQQLGEQGVSVRVKSLDFGAWMEGMSRGEFQLAIGWSSDGPTPYDLYQGLMSPQTVKPVGESTGVNWHRFGDAASEGPLTVLETDPDPAAQAVAIDTLQARFVELAPAIPLFPSPSWGQANTRRFTGFPSAEDPYALLSPHKAPESLLVLTRLQAREDPP